MKQHILLSLAALAFSVMVTGQTMVGCPGIHPDKSMRHSDQLTSYDGLGRESVFHFYKDKTGLLWLATNKGVRSYNGHVVTPVHSDKDVGLVITLQETDDGTLLAGCSTGLYKINREKYTMRQIEPGITDVNVICGPLVGGACGLWMEKDGQYTSLPIESSIISRGNFVTDIVPDGKDKVWLSTTKRLVHLTLADGSMQKYNIPDSLLTHNIRHICLIGKNLYIGTRNDGLLMFDTRTHQTRRGVAVPSNVITDLHSDGQRYLYVATDGSGAYTIDTRTQQIVKEYHGKTDAVYTFGHDTVLDIDYFGFYLEGFSHQLSVRHLVSTYRHGELNTATLPTRSLSRHGHLMAIGTRKGLYLIDETADTVTLGTQEPHSKAVSYFSPEELGASIVTDIQFFAGQFIVATYESGLRRLTTDGQLQPLVSNGSFSSLRLDPKGERLFAVGNTGVTIFNKELAVVNHFNCKNSELADEYITDILPDRTGKAWVGSLSRLYLYDPVMQTVQASGFPADFFNQAPSLHFTTAADGDILAWSGSHLYKAKIDCSSYEEIPLHQRLHTGDILFIRWYNNHYWIGTTQGLFVTDENFSADALHLSEADGLPSPRFQNQECILTDDGTLWMATDWGIATISHRQQQHLRDSIPAHVVLNSVEWDGSKLVTFQPLLLNYSTDLGKMYQYTLDQGDTLVCTDGDMVPLGWQHWGKHRLTVWLMGHPETQMQLTYWYLPSALFWAICVIIVLIALSLWLVRHEAINTYKEQQEKRRQREEAARQAKLYERQRLTDNECAALYEKVQEYVDQTHCYTNPTLRIADLAEAIDTHQAKLSQMFSTHLHTSFADYVNRQRIEEFKRRAADAQYHPYATVALAEMCGLKKSAFFAAFKKYEGCTPNEWMEREGIERR